MELALILPLGGASLLLGFLLGFRLAGVKEIEGMELSYFKRPGCLVPLPLVVAALFWRTVLDLGLPVATGTAGIGLITGALWAMWSARSS